jgi:hypothetical protein
VQQEIDRRPSAQLERTQSLLRIDPAPCLGARELARDVHEDDDRELQAFGLVDGHHADAVAVLF